MCSALVYLMLLAPLADRTASTPPMTATPIQVPPEEKILATLRTGHPRLIALAEDTARLKKLLAEDATAAAFYKELRAQADALLRDKRTVEYRLVGPRLLGESRRCLERVYTLATVYRLDGDRRYAERAIQEMLAAAAFPDWNPKHFLDTAEMTHALAIGYDWLFDVLSADQRKTIREAILRHGLREGEKIYRRGGWWTATQYNWNQVCNGGMTVGALALADEEPKLASFIVHQAVRSVQRAMQEYGPDGAWAEGPGYWNYATVVQRIHAGRPGNRPGHGFRPKPDARVFCGRGFPNPYARAYGTDVQFCGCRFRGGAIAVHVLAGPKVQPAMVRLA